MAGKETASRQTQAEKLALLVYLLQLLTALFGITTVMGILINHSLKEKVRDTLATSHFKWQVLTFWVSFTIFITGMLIGGTAGWYLSLSALVWIYYRAVKGMISLRRKREAPDY